MQTHPNELHIFIYFFGKQHRQCQEMVDWFQVLRVEFHTYSFIVLDFVQESQWKLNRKMNWEKEDDTCHPRTLGGKLLRWCNYIYIWGKQTTNISEEERQQTTV